MSVYLGCDLGTKTIGLAVSDAGEMIATPLLTITRSKFSKDMQQLKEIITANQVEAMVIGLPVNMDGSSGGRVQATKAFARHVEQQLGINVHFWDERLSTMAVERVMLEADMSRAKRAMHVDKLAAAYILQGFLDAKRNQTTQMLLTHPPT